MQEMTNGQPSVEVAAARVQPEGWVLAAENPTVAVSPAMTLNVTTALATAMFAVGTDASMANCKVEIELSERRDSQGGGGEAQGGGVAGGLVRFEMVRWLPPCVRPT